MIKETLLVLIVTISGCSTNYIVHSTRNISNSCHATPSNNCHQVEKSKEVVALFLDGTDNNLNADTNVSRLYHKVKSQNIANLHTYYGEGVGVGWKYIGAGSGWGLDTDVAEAYAFLSYFYEQDKSDIYIFGFSRGAYTARVLTGMIYTFGIYDLSEYSESERIKLSKKLYTLYKKGNKFEEPPADFSTNNVHTLSKCRHRDVSDIVDEAAKLKEFHSRSCEDLNVKIRFMGLFDTVEALGVVPTGRAISRHFGADNTPNVIFPNDRYIDQVCNIEKVYHALSLDDNRGHLFVPISINSENTHWRCSGFEKQYLANSEVKEVWFSGAHSDVGGGYLASDNGGEGYEYLDLGLSGYAANWMLSALQNDGIVSDTTKFPENFKADLHDAENSSLMYEEFPRNLVFEQYLRTTKMNRFLIHPSAIKRVELTGYAKESTIKPYSRKVEFGHFNEYGFDSKWYSSSTFEDCFEIEGVNVNFLEDSKCSVIERYAPN
ncbi:DUF2235 domain-containing protein [Vibrio owensii]|uniref:DUF2235 domain-containing protein n=1 Tax=Vibrio owensii TaxID=696485 RepID=UPI002F41B10E